MKNYVLLSLVLLSLVVSQCATPPSTVYEPVEEEITSESLAQHIEILASDEFQGRMPFTEGEEKTLDYIRSQFRQMGIEPGNNDSYFQEVPLIEASIDSMSDLTISGSNGEISFSFRDHFVAGSKRISDRIHIDNSELVFAGFGIVAPEYGWNDYEGLDVEGKTVLVLVNDPGYGEGNEDIFRNEAMTYYGRWTYKFEEASRQGATGVIVIHQTGPAGYPWPVIGNAPRASMQLEAENLNMDRTAFEGWINEETAREIFAHAGMENFDFRAAARQRDFEAIPLDLKVSLYMERSFERDVSHNVVGIITGSERPDEYIIYSAHWDHLGIGDPVDGDSIFNGAIDNASGVAAVLEIARAFKKLPQRQERTMVFLLVTAEEQGLLGSAYYADHPIFPPEQTVANINIDALLAAGTMKDLTVVGYGQSELDDYARWAASLQDRYVLPDQEPEKGFFFRSDHFSFAKIGIPALYASGRHEHAEHGVEYAREKVEEYNTQRYHRTADVYDPQTWDMRGMVEDTQLMFLIGHRLSNETHFPEWSEFSEFRSVREVSRGIND